MPNDGSTAESPRRVWAGALAPAKLLRAATRTGEFTARSMPRLLRPHSDPDVPVRRMTPAMVAAVFADELVLAQGTARRAPDPPELRRIRHDTDRALEVFEANGWLDDPASYHQEPPSPDHFVLEPGRYHHIRYQRLSFESGYRPPDGLPCAERWLAREANRHCYAYVMEHRGGPRPWVVLIPGFAMGVPSDLVAMQALAFHRDLGFNVLSVVLPLHGPRREGGSSGEGLLTFDWVCNVHALSQAVWDVRRCLAWARHRGARSIAVHGLSLGGYTGALLTGVDGDLDCVVAGVPSGSMFQSLRRSVARLPDTGRSMEQHGLLGAPAEAVHTVVTPLALTCLVPRERRFIYAGVADRLNTPDDPCLLWKHWDKPSIFWSGTGHVITPYSPKVRRFVRDAVTSCAAPSGQGTNAAAPALASARTASATG